MSFTYAKAVIPALLLALLCVLPGCVGAPPVQDPDADAQSTAETANQTETDNPTDSPTNPDADAATDSPTDPNSDAATSTEPENGTDMDPDAATGNGTDPDDGTSTDPDAPDPIESVLMPDPVSVVSEEAENCAVFGSDVSRKQILSLTFLSGLADAPDSAWDVSAARDRSALAWRTGSGGQYNLYIAGDGVIFAPPDCSDMFCGYSNLQRVTFDAPFDTSRATDMRGLFDSCVSLTALDVSGFDTSAVTDMESMFRHCSALKTLDVSGFDTSNVTDMRSMFRRCTSLTALDVSGFDISHVTDARWMFADCVGLDRLDTGSVDFSAVELHDSYLKNVPMKLTATPLTGTEGYEGRNYDALFDGDTSTKWCLPFENSAYVEWKMACAGSVAELSLTSADNHDEYPGRNPGSWRLLGTDRENRRNGVWTVLGEMNPAGFEGHDTQNYLVHTTYFSGEPPVFDYYRLEITSTTGAQILQISEIAMTYR